MRSIIILIALVCPDGGSGTLLAQQGDKNRPVSKVVTLLKDMLKQLQEEADQDEEIYDKLACWCETYDKEKTKAIADAEKTIEMLTTSIEEDTANSARLHTEIENLEKEIAANQAALDKATAIRQKELADFNGDEKDLLQSISALSAAITVLQKHHGGALLQMPLSHMAGIAASLQHEMDKNRHLLRGVLTPSQKRLMAAFIQSPQDYFDASPTFKESYAPQSGEIFGILKQMKETFESNLSESQKQEAAAQKAYDDLKVAKEKEIQAGQDQAKTKKTNLAETNEKLANSKEELEDTRKSLAADQEFLMMLKEKCSMTDTEWETRQKTRAAEMKAVSEALAILNSDDAHDTFSSTFNKFFLQTRRESSRREAAARVLMRAANKLNRPRLGALAIKAKLDAFTKVKQAIDDMIAELLKQKEDEIKQKDWCVDNIHQNEKDTAKNTRDISDSQTKIDDLEAAIATHKKNIEDATAAIQEMQTQLKRAGEDREAENADFQKTVAEQRQAQLLLQKALQKLEGFYNKKLLLLQQPAGPAPPAGFKSYENNQAAGGVMGLIKTIINDAKAMETEAIRDEQEAQASYESLVKETNKNIEEKNKFIVNETEKKAAAEEDHVNEKANMKDLKLTQETLSNEKQDLDHSCTFLLKNFDVRQQLRDDEVEALRQAKAILSGAKFEE